MEFPNTKIDRAEYMMLHSMVFNCQNCSEEKSIEEIGCTHCLNARNIEGYKVLLAIDVKHALQEEESADRRGIDGNIK